MAQRIRNIVLTCGFLFVTLGFGTLGLAAPDQALSTSERRHLAQFPEFTAERMLDGTFFSDFEDYAVDQFPFRDSFRTIKAVSVSDVFLRTDNHGVYLVDGGVYKMEFPLDETSIVDAATHFNELRAQYLSGCRVFSAVVPDKGSFVAAASGRLALDERRLAALLTARLDGIATIDVSDLLSVDDFYRTDLHWRQERILDIADRLLTGMGHPGATDDDFARHEQSPFYGSYYGQAALPVAPDTLVYLTDPMLDGCTVFDAEDGSRRGIYATDLFGGMDSYDVFLSGAKPILTVENPAQTNGRTLYLFRDSFGSSLAPLLVREYATVVLIDLRYVDSSVLSRYVDFQSGNDALFLYSTTVLNHGAMLR